MSTTTDPSLPPVDAATLASVQALLADVLGLTPAAIAPTAALIDDLGAESIDFLDMSFRLEQQYGCTLPTAEWAEFLRAHPTVVTTDDLALLEQRCGLNLTAADREMAIQSGLEAAARLLAERDGVSIPHDALVDVARRAVRRSAEAFERIFGVTFPPDAREQLSALAAVDARSAPFRAATRRIFTVDVLARFVARHRTVGEEARACGT
jgi:acyl carrier protein